MMSSHTPHAELPGDAWLKSMHAPCQQVHCKCGGTCDEGARPLLCRLGQAQTEQRRS